MIYNKNKISKVLYNQNRISKILLNKNALYESRLNPEDAEGFLNIKLPQIPGITEYFIFLLLTHKPITQRDTIIDNALEDLCQGYVKVPFGIFDKEIVKFSKFGISLTNSPFDTTSADLFFGNVLDNQINGNPNPDFSYNFERITSTDLSSGVIRFYEGSISHYKPIEGVLDNFSICGKGTTQLFSAFLFGQTNKVTENPLKQVSCKIDFSSSNSAFGNSMYNVYTYCIKSTGQYKLLTKDSFFDRNSNTLQMSYETDIYDYRWFDGIQGT